ncbi:MAG: hypothetical protein ABIE74_03695 [Pseudomonadota bacterium]
MNTPLYDNCRDASILHLKKTRPAFYLVRKAFVMWGKILRSVTRVARSINRKGSNFDKECGVYLSRMHSTQYQNVKMTLRRYIADARKCQAQAIHNARIWSVAGLLSVAKVSLERMKAKSALVKKDGKLKSAKVKLYAVTLTYARLTRYLSELNQRCLKSRGFVVCRSAQSEARRTSVRATRLYESSKNYVRRLNKDQKAVDDMLK